MENSQSSAEQIWQLFGITEPIVLASTSPRRAALLRAVGCPIEVVAPAGVEGEYTVWDGGEQLRRWAVQKAESVRKRLPHRSVLAADTVVRLGDAIFGKPGDESAAAAMLTSLSGRTHEVWTALHFIPANKGKGRTAVTCTQVTFRTLSEEEIRAYVASGEPLDKAGAYGIQGIGGLWVDKIDGCYFNVVGLPLSQFRDLLKSAGGDR